SQPTASRSGERYSKMPSSTLRRSPARTLSAMGFSRWSVMVSVWLISSCPNVSTASNAPNGSSSAPEQQERHTNITVHGEKRSVELAQIVGLHERMFVSEQGGNHHDTKPRGPGQREARGEPREQRDHGEVHHARNEQSVRDAKALGNGVQASASVIVKVLAGVKHVEAADPKSDRGAQDQHAGIESASDRDPCRGR